MYIMCLVYVEMLYSLLELPIMKENSELWYVAFRCLEELLCGGYYELYLAWAAGC